MSLGHRIQAKLDKIPTTLNLDNNQKELIKPIIAEQNTKIIVTRSQRMANNVNDLTNEDRKALMQKRPEEKTATNK